MSSIIRLVCLSSSERLEYQVLSSMDEEVSPCDEPRRSKDPKNSMLISCCFVTLSYSDGSLRGPLCAIRASESRIFLLSLLQLQEALVQIDKLPCANPLSGFSVPSFLSFILSLASAIGFSVSLLTQSLFSLLYIVLRVAYG